jgi:4-hydroxy-tetrahydrodipicolinate reductase
MKLGITAANGKMGQALILAIKQSPDFRLSTVLVRDVNHLTSEIGLPDYTIITEQAEKFCESAEIIIDFSSPKLTCQIIEAATKHKVPVVSGTTGLTNNEIKLLENYAKIIPIVYSGNMSIGINLIQMLLNKTAKTLDQSFDVEIIEKHHRNKVDAPSGTALMLAKSITDAKGLDFDKSIIYSRVGHTGPRPKEKIGISSIRAGNIIGEHDIMFVSDAEVITIAHQALNRNIFVNGALKACNWIVNQPAGFYSMQDVLLNT